MFIFISIKFFRMQAVEDFHAQIGSVASTLLDEFRLALQ